MSQVILDPLMKQLMEQAAIGEAADEFMRSGLGEYLIKRATDEADSAMMELVDVDPTSPAKVAELQFRIKVATTAISWLNEAVAEGRNALRQIHDES